MRTMKICPRCKFKPKLGRPRELDDRKVKALRRAKWSVQAIAAKFDVSKTAVYKALARKAA